MRHFGSAFIVLEMLALITEAKFIVNFNDGSQSVWLDETIPLLFNETDFWGFYETVLVRGQVALLTQSQLDQMNCVQPYNQSLILMKQLANKIIIIRRGLFTAPRYLCNLGTVNYWNQWASGFSTICSLRPKALVVLQPAIQYFSTKRYFSPSGKEILRRYGFDPSCLIFFSYGSNSYLREMDLKFYSTFTNETNLSAELLVDDSAFRVHRQTSSTFNFVFLRVWSPIIFFLLFVLSIKLFWWRWKMQKLNSVYTALYVINGTSALILVFVFVMGPFAMFELKSFEHESLIYSTYDLFLSFNCSTDYLTTILYSSACEKVTRDRRRRFFLFKYPIMTCFASLVFATQIAYILATNLPSANVQLVLITIPVLSCLLQIAVTVYVLKRVCQTTKELKRVNMKTQETKDVEIQHQSTIKLENQMRFWVKISVVGSILSIGGLLMFLALTNDVQYIGLWSYVYTTGRHVNMWSQLMISSPVNTKKKALILPKEAELRTREIKTTQA